MCQAFIGECYFNNDGTIGFITEKFKAHDIPWLEVCLFHLPKALASPNNRAHDMSVRISYHLHDFFHHSKHPVDYLYREYQDQTAWKKK